MKAADARAFGPRCAADGGFKPGETPRRLKTCGLSLCGCRHIFIPKSTGRRIRKRLPGLAFSIRAEETPRRLKACGLSLCGCRHIFIRKNQGLKICKQFSGPAFFG